MALETTDLLAVWRSTEKKNYSVAVSTLMEQVPAAPVPTLTAVLQANNTSQGIGINIENANGSADAIVLDPDGTSKILLDLEVDNQLIVGATPKIYLKSDGEIKGYDINLLGNTTTATALAVYSAGSDIDALDTDDQVVNITNTGAATFAGALEALSIDGGVYAE